MAPRLRGGGAGATRSCTRSTRSAACAGTRRSPTSTRRASAANLTILADTLVDRVLLEGDRAVGVATAGGELRARDGRARRRRVRLAGDPAAQRDRPGAWAAGRRGSVRPRRRRVRLRGTDLLQREAAAFERAQPLFMAQVTVALGSSGCAPGLPTSSSSPRRPARRARLRGQRGGLRDEAGIPRLGPPDLARSARAARHRPWLPVRPARRRGPRRGCRGAARARRAATRFARTPARDPPRPGGRRADARARGAYAVSSTRSPPARSAGSSTAAGASTGSTGCSSPTPRSCRRSRARTRTSTVALAERLAESIARSL